MRRCRLLPYYIIEKKACIFIPWSSRTLLFDIAESEAGNMHSESEAPADHWSQVCRCDDRQHAHRYRGRIESLYMEGEEQRGKGHEKNPLST